MEENKEKAIESENIGGGRKEVKIEVNCETFLNRKNHRTYHDS